MNSEIDKKYFSELRICAKTVNGSEIKHRYCDSRFEEQ